ncbi:MAG: GNAT family N-acetyltransferase [Firmicutes bacterium]|nr:GNAT family N-acetyltransferase [Bacillota bacterium]
MDRISIKPVVTRNDMRDFLWLPWNLYKNDPNWVPPLLNEVKKQLDPRFNPLLTRGPYRLFLACDSVGRPLSRVMVGIDQADNEGKAKKEGYLALYEAVNEESSTLILNHACTWLANQGIHLVRGPISPTKGENLRGLLIWGFDSPPVLMNAYNPPEYATYFEKAGFTKDVDYYAYHYDLKRIDVRKTERVVSYAQNKYGFRVNSFDRNNIEAELADLKSILEHARPEDWGDLSPPNLEDLRAYAFQLRDLIIPELIPIARNLEGKPIGFAASIPDYHRVLMKNSSFPFPTGWAKFLFNRHRVSGARVFLLFVIPEYRKKGVSGTLFYHLLLKAKEFGFTYGEGSIVAEFNIPMRRGAERAGGLHYRTYRVYKKEL